MTNEEFINEISTNYLDVNKLVKPKASFTDSDNGVLFTSICQILQNGPVYQSSIDACFKEPGLLNRRPNDSSSQEGWDDYCGRAVACIYTGNTKEARQILWYFITHFGFMNNTDSFNWASWLPRAVSTWVLMFAAAFPLLKYLTYPFLTIWCANFNPNDKNDGNGIQLQWLQVMGHRKLFGDKVYNAWYNKYKANTGSVLSVPFTGYYEADHPIVIWIKENYDSGL